MNQLATFALRAISVLSLFALTLLDSATADDWPMWRANASRSAATTNQLPSEFDTQWSRRFLPRAQAWDDPLNLDLMTYDRVFEPIVYKGLVCIGFNDQDKLVALDVKTGETAWTYYTEGPVRLPPVGHDGKIYFGSDDGFLYCVHAADGSPRLEIPWCSQQPTCSWQQASDFCMARPRWSRRV